MKKVMKKFNRALSIMLVAAMVLTMAPQTAMPVLAASEADGVTSGETAENGKAIVGGTDETPEAEQSEKVKDSSDEGNPDSKNDDISNADPSDEVPDENEPSEGDAEDPAEEETEVPAITANQMTIMGGPEDGDQGTTAKKVWPNIDNGKKSEWRLTELTPLPTATDGKQYITVKQKDGWDVFSLDGTSYYSADENALTDKILAFGAQPQDGYRFKSETGSDQVKATLEGKKESNYTTIKNNIAAAYVEEAADDVPAHYEINLGTAIAAADFADYDELRLSVWADVEEIPSYTVTLPGADAHATVAIISGAKAGEDGVYKTDAEEDIVFSVTPDTGYALAAANPVQYKVGTGSATDAAADGSNYKIEKSAITGNITIQVTTVEKEYTISFNVTGAKVTVGEAEASENPDAVTKKLGDTVTFVVTPDTGMKLRYVNTADNDTDAMEPTSTDAEAGTYTFAYTVDETTEETTTIYVNATALQNVAVSFDTGSDTGVSVYEVKETGTDTKVLKVETEAVSSSVSAKEDSKVYFIAEPSETSVYKIVSVKVGDEDVPHETKIVKRTVDSEEKEVEVDLYTLDLKDVTAAAVQVTIATELDESKANVATFSLAGEDGCGYTATVADKEYTAGDKIVTADDSISFEVEPTEPYFVIDKVEAVYEAVYEADKEDGTDKEEKTVVLAKDSNSGSYTFAFKNGNTKVTSVVDIKVTVSTQATAEAKTITFNNISNQTKYEVAVKDEDHPDEKVTKKADTKHTYIVETGAKYVNVTVTVSGKYEPWVGVMENEELTQEFKGQKTEEAGVYQYAIPAAALADGSDTIVTIGAKAEQKWIAVLYNSTEAKVSASVSGQEISESEDITEDEMAEFENFDSNYAVYKVPTDTEITVAVTALDNSSVKSYTIGSTTKNLKVASGKTGEFKVKAADNTTVQINTESVYAVTLKDAADNAVAGAKDVYTVDYGTAYTAALWKGDARASVTAVTVEGTDAVSTAAVEEGTDRGYKVAKINVAAADAGKTLTVKLSVKGKVTAADGTEQEDHVIVHTFKLSVKPKATKLEIKGAKNGKITQPVDTLTEYVITPTPKTISLSNIETEVTAAAEDADAAAVDLVQAAITAEGKLAVTTKAVKDPADNVENAAKIVLKDKTTKDVISSVIVDVTKPALMDQTPGVKAVGSDDVSLKLELSTPNKVTPPSAGKLWYKVVVTTEDANAGEEITNRIAKPFYIAKSEAASQIEDITVNSKRKGDGKACSFKVAVTLVQTLDKTTNLETAEDAAITAATSCVSKVKENVAASTKTPYYTSKLSLKKGATTVYTGQRIKIATPQFDKNTTFTEIEAKNIHDTTVEDTYYDDTVSFDVDANGDIYMSVAPGEYADYDGDGVDEYYESTPLGKHTIEVTAFAPDNAYAAKATLTVNVVRGIEQISLSAPDTIYKADKKAAALKLTPTFNRGYTDKTRAPQAKKVTYKIVDSYNGNSMSDALKAAVSVKNGTVTVAKNYNVSADSNNNMFAVEVTAVDFTGNTVSGVSNDITITSTGMGLGEVCIADRAWVKDDYTDNQVPQYTVLSRKTSFTSKELNGKYLIVLKPGTPEKSVYSADEVIEAKNLTYKSGNKALTVYASGYLSVSKTANNVKLTATANDGSKKSVDKTINIVYDEPAQLGLRVERRNDFDGNYYPIGDDNSSAFTFKGTTDTVLRLTVVQRDNDNSDWKEVDQITDFKLTPNGAKVLNKNSRFNQCQEVIANKAVINVKLTIGSGSNKKDQTYTITNESFSNVKAPKVKGSGNLKTWLSEQTITYQVTDTNPATYSGMKWVMVTTDATDRAKKTYAYSQLEQAADGALNGYHPIDKNGRFDLNFAMYYQTDPDADYGELYHYNIPSGNYKLQFTFGTVDEDGAFIPETKTVAVTLKAEAQKKVKGSYKAVSSVKMSLKDGARARLAGTGNNYRDEVFGGVYSDELQNANINGAANNFRKYFAIEYEWDAANYKGIYYLTLKPQGDGTNGTLTADEIAYITGDSKEAKNDRIGYVPYSVDIEGVGWKEDTAKITVNFDKNADKTLLTYKASAPTIMEGTTEEFEINVTAGKANVQLRYAYIESDSFEAVNMSCADGSVINVKAKTAPAVGNYAAAVYIVPSDSYYVSEVEAAYGDWAKAADADRATKFADFTAKIKNRGVPVNTTIKVTAKANTGGKIKIDKKDTAQVFSQDKYNAEYLHYFVHVPYTKTMPCNITEIASNDTYLNGVAGVTEGRKNLFDFYAEPEFDPYDDPDAFQAISVTIDKDNLKKALDAKKVQLGKTYTVKATVKFGKQVQNTEGELEWQNDNTIKTETITLKLTLPKAITATGYTDAVTAVTAAKAGIAERVSANHVIERSWLTLAERDDDEEINWGEPGVGVPPLWTYDVVDDYIEPVLNELEAEVSALAPEDSGTRVVLPQYQLDQYLYVPLLNDREKFKAPTSQRDGYFKAVVRLAKTAEYNDEEGAESATGTYEDITFDITIKLGETIERPYDIKAALEDFADKMGSNEAYTKAQNEWELREAIQRDARTAVEISKYPTLRMSVEAKEWDEESEDWKEVDFFTPATDQKEGSIKGVFHVWGIRYGGEELYVPIDVTLDKLDDIMETAGKIEEALADLEPTNLMTKDGVMKAAKAAIVNEQFELEWKQVENPDKDEEGQPETIDDWDLKPATREKDGSITGTLLLVNTKAAEGDASNKQTEIKIDWPIPQLEGSETAVTNLRNALGIDEAGKVDADEENAAVFKALVISNDSDTVQADILAAAKKAVEKDGFSVEYEKEGDEVAFKFTKVMYKAGKDADGNDVSGKGTVKYTLVVTDEQAEEGATDASQKVTCDAEFGPYPELATLADAKAEVEAALMDEAYLLTLTNETTAASISGAAKMAITEGANIDVAVKKDADDKDVFTLNKATFQEAGEIQITLVLTKYEMVDNEKKVIGEPLDVELTLAVAKLTQSIIDAETAAQTALDDASLVFTNDDIADDEAKKATKKKILDAVKAVVNTEQYDVTAKDDAITVKAATINEAGSVKITVVITEKSPAEGSTAAEKELAEKSYTIVALDQSLADAKTAAEDAIDAYGNSADLKMGEDDKDAILTAVQAVLKTGKFTAAWSTETGKGFTLTEAKAADEEGGEATPGSITGEILISVTDDETIEPAKVTVNITWPYVAPVAPEEP